MEKDPDMTDFDALFPDDRLTGEGWLRQGQLVMTRLLKILDRICKDNGLSYWLDAGTLLGAARHGGFIPWDNDVDVMMPADDYRVFTEIAGKSVPHDVFFQTKETDPEHDITWAKFRDRFSYMDDPGGPYPYSQGIPIDIFPAYVQTRRQFRMRNIFGLLPPFNNPPLKTSPRYSFKHNAYNFAWGTIQKTASLFLKSRPLRDALVKWGEKGEKGWTYDPERPWFQFFPLDCVFPLSTISFEGYEFLCPRDVNRYLTIYYGDWKTPPPEKNRHCHGLKGIHPTDPGPKPHSSSLKWEDYHKTEPTEK